jgi:hypothetical protein
VIQKGKEMIALFIEPKAKELLLDCDGGTQHDFVGNELILDDDSLPCQLRFPKQPGR